jgi:hypothetical protein
MINKCGCGGVPELYQALGFPREYHYFCPDCGSRSKISNTKIGALRNWNTAHPDYSEQIGMICPDPTKHKWLNEQIAELQKQVEVLTKALDKAVYSINDDAVYMLPIKAEMFIKEAQEEQCPTALK